MNTTPIINAPDGESLFHSIAGNFTKCSQIICEFIDNALSNLRAHGDEGDLVRCVDLRLEDRGDFVEVMVRDGGTGILDLDNALTIAGRVGAESPLSEHGMGIKHALASVDAGPSQDWTIQTRTEEDAALDRHKQVRSPYGIGTMSWTAVPGKGDIEARTGTVITFRCPKSVFNTLNPGRSEVSFSKLTDYLAEELRYTYGRILRAGEFWINLTEVDLGGKVRRHLVNAPLEPQWAEGTRVDLPRVAVDLGGGPVILECRYGLVNANEGTLLHYKANMATSGVELSVNGRVIEHGLCGRIFGEALHPSQNGFLAQINLEADSPAALPATKAAKNAFREDDPRLEALFRWIRANVRRPDKDCRSREEKLVDMLRDKELARPGVLRVSKEEGVYQSVGLKVKVDLFVSRSDGVTLYEAKARTSKAEDLYQLLMYWDGAALDGKGADEAVLIAERHPEEVSRLLAQLNGRADPTGRPCRFRLLTWSEAGIRDGSAA